MSWILTTRQRYALGIMVIFVVDIIWVASSEATEFLFKGSTPFKKPYFTTYVKTSLFSLYLLFIGICRGFDCSSGGGSSGGGGLREDGSSSNGGSSRAVTGPPSYRALDESSADQLSSENEAVQPSLTESSWVPTRYHDGTSDRGSGLDSDSDAWAKQSAEARKNVRFSRVSEVRQLCDDRDESAKLARLSYEMSVRLEELNRRQSAKLSTKEVLVLAVKFCVLWFIGQYSYQAALAETEAGVVNVLSASSALFTLLLAAVFPSSDLDGITVTKTILVFLNIIGIALVSLSDLGVEDGKVAVGALWALVSALFYSIYLVTLRKEARHEDSLNMPLFFGFVGLINMCILWPGLFALHYLGYEIWELPTKEQWVILLTNGLVGTVLAELLWLWACFLTSSLTTTLGVSLTIPVTVLADKLYRDVQYPRMFFYGATPVVASFLALALVQNRGSDWDPVLSLLRFMANIPVVVVRGLITCCVGCVRCCRRRRRGVDDDDDEPGGRRRSGSGNRLLGDSDEEDEEVGSDRRFLPKEEETERSDERIPIIDAVDGNDDEEVGVNHEPTIDVSEVDTFQNEASRGVTA